MELLFKRILVTVIAASVAVPSVYLTLHYYQGSQYVKDSENYIPSNASFAAMVRNSGSVYYPFVSSGAPGIVASISVFDIPQLLAYQGVSSNATQNITLSYFEEYRGVSVFMLEGVGAGSILWAFAGNALGVDLFLNFSADPELLDNITFFVACPQNTLSIIGSRSTVENSVDACLDHQNLAAVKGLRLDAASNASILYFPPQSAPLEHVSANLSYNHTEVYLHFRSLNSTTKLTLSTLAIKAGFQVKAQSNSIELDIGTGYNAFYRFFSTSGIASGGIPGLKG